MVDVVRADREYAPRMSSLAAASTRMVALVSAIAAALAAAAFLEAAFALCLGCIMFRFLMRLGVIPERVCEQCNNLVLQPSTHA